MTDRIFAALSVGTLGVAGGLVWAGVNVAAAQHHRSILAPALELRAIPRDDSGMVALQRHAQVDMLLYFGPNDGSNVASRSLPVDAVALTLPSVTR